MKSEFKTDTIMILSIAVLTIGVFAGGVTSMITNDGATAAKAEAAHIATSATAVRPVAIKA